MKKFAHLALLLTFLGQPLVAFAEDKACTREGINSCFVIQVANLRHTDADYNLLSANFVSGTDKLFKEVQNGAGHFSGQKSGGHFFLWLKPEVANSEYKIPADAMREFKYSKNSPTPKVEGVQFITNPENFPVIDDPRLPGLGTPDYVIYADGGTGGLGLAIPVSLREKLDYVAYCPDGQTTMPSRAQNEGIHWGPKRIAQWISRDWEYVGAVTLQ